MSPDGVDWRLPARVEAFRQPIVHSDVPTLVLYPGPAPGDPGRWAAQGVFLGSTFLYAQTRPGIGYTSIGQRVVSRRLCQDVHGWVCDGAIDYLVEREPTTGQRWVDLLGIDQLVVHRRLPLDRLRAGLGADFAPAKQTRDFVVLRRTVPRPAHAGRVTAVRRCRLLATAERVARRSQEYLLTGEPCAHGSLVFSDLWWPGYQATLDGRSVKAAALRGAVLTVILDDVHPPARLRVEYWPRGLSPALRLAMAGAVAAVLWAGVLWRWPPARQASSASRAPKRVSQVL